MRRRLNSTGRRRIERKNIELSLRASDKSGPIFDLDLNLEDYSFPPDAQVRVEAWRGHAVQRWDYGTVAALASVPEEQRRMTEVPESAQFRIFIVASRWFGGEYSVTRPRSNHRCQTDRCCLCAKPMNSETKCGAWTSVVGTIGQSFLSTTRLRASVMLYETMFRFAPLLCRRFCERYSRILRLFKEPIRTKKMEHGKNGFGSSEL